MRRKSIGGPGNDSCGVCLLFSGFALWFFWGLTHATIGVCVCMHACMHACMHVCMYVYTYMYRRTMDPREACNSSFFNFHDLSGMVDACRIFFIERTNSGQLALYSNKRLGLQLDYMGVQGPTADSKIVHSVQRGLHRAKG